MPTTVLSTSLGEVELARHRPELPPVLVFPGGHCTAAANLGWELFERAGFGVISVSRPGYGRTSVGELTAREFVPAVTEALARLGVDRLAAVVGISFGGLQAIEFALSGGPRPSSLILASAAPSALPFPDAAKERLIAPIAFGPRTQRLTWASVRAVVRADAGLRAMGASLSTLPAGRWWGTWSAEDRRRARELFGSMSSGSGFLNDLRQATEAEREARAAALAGLELPTLVLASPHDGSVSMAHAEDFASRIRGARLVRTAAPSHLFWLGSAAETIGSEIGAFLREPCPRPSASPDSWPTIGRVPVADGRGLETFTWGDGPDVVVLEAGLGFSGRYWGPTARELAKAGVRAVAYDRAGFGGSDPDPLPRTLGRLAGDLREVAAAQRARRLVLVGHSWGGPIVRVAAMADDDRTIGGLVLADPSDEHLGYYFTRVAKLSDRLQELALPPLARLGLLRPMMRAAASGRLAEADRASVVDASSSASAARVTIEESRRLRPGLRALLAAGAEPRVPTTVISGMLGPAWARRELIRAHREAAERAGGRFVPARASSHMVPLTEPEVIAQEALRLLRG